MTTVLAGLDLAALLCSRVCHDLISPTGAIVNGLEVLEDLKDEETRDFALALIKKSAGQAAARLQFCRLAFGAAGSAGAEINLGDAESVARGFVEDDKDQARLEPAARPCAQEPGEAAAQSLAGGHAGHSPRRHAQRRGRPLTGLPDHRQWNERPHPAAGGTLPHGRSRWTAVDAHAIQPYYAALLAQDCGLRVSLVKRRRGDRHLGAITVAHKTKTPPVSAGCVHDRRNAASG